MKSVHVFASLKMAECLKQNKACLELSSNMCSLLIEFTTLVEAFSISALLASPL